MIPQLLFGVAILLGFLVWSIVTAQYIWPALRARSAPERFRPILLLHSFRYIGLAFLVPGVVAPELPAAFARPAAYGDLIASVLALATLAFLQAEIGSVLLWLFNLWGTADLLYAYYQGAIGTSQAPGQLGATYFLPTAVVPLLLITHVLVFRMLLLPDHTPAQRAA
jgi:hypothetical protein